MKRYLVFICDKYEPYGGMKDFRGDFDTLEQAEAFLSGALSGTVKWDKGHIWDCSKREIIKEIE